MTRTTKANSILGGIIAVMLLLAVGYYIAARPDTTAQAPAAPAASDTAQTQTQTPAPAPAPAPGTDPTSTGSTNP